MDHLAVDHTGLQGLSTVGGSQALQCIHRQEEGTRQPSCVRTQNNEPTTNQGAKRRESVAADIGRVAEAF